MSKRKAQSTTAWAIGRQKKKRIVEPQSDDDEPLPHMPDTPPQPQSPDILHSPPSSPLPMLAAPQSPGQHDPHLQAPNIAEGANKDELQNISATEKKVVQPSPKKKIESYDDNTNVVVSVGSLKKLLQGRLNTCDCGGELVLDVHNKNLGVAVGARLVCWVCKRISADRVLSPRFGGGEKGKVELNERFASAVSAAGVGYQGANTFSMFMNMPIMSHTSFIKNCHSTFQRVEHVLEDSLARARQKVRDIYRSKDPSIGVDDIIDICVSFDGSWKKRGFKSLFSFAAVIEVQTGLVIDFVVLSKFCTQCNQIEASCLDTDSDEYQQWYTAHKRFCDKNCDPNMPSGNMEVESAKIMFSRSIRLSNFRYLRMVSDGDAKTISALTSLDPYQGQIVQKEECVNHVSKRLGTALRQAVQKSKAEKQSIGGRGPGMLTDVKIKKLTHYYGLAVRRYTGTTVEDMRKGILASLLHCTATDELASHKYCPDSTEALESWCFWKRAFGEGRDPTPGETHKAMLGTVLSKEVSNQIYPIYQRLTDSALLSRCLLGANQNRNESLHNLIWSKLPKEKHHTLYRLRHASGQAVMIFNEGHASIQIQVSALGYGEGKITTHQQKDKDQKRINFAIARRDTKTINRIKVRQRAKAVAARRAGKQEQLYGPGIAGTSTSD